MKQLLLVLGLVLSCASWTLAQRMISGTITDDAGEPLIGANVVVENTTIGTITDFEGQFELEVPADATKLVISYTGFSTKTVDLTPGVSTFDLVLDQGELLDEVVVTGFTTNRNSRNVTYANQTVSSEDLLSQPNNNALEALRGKAAGVKINTGSGSVGASSRIVLRGESTLTGNNNALIVIDGIAVDNAASRGGSGTAQDGYADYGNRFNDLNPNDIETMTILKGPAATALYGSRGSAGVVVITTKKGTRDNFKIDLNSTYSQQRANVVLERQDQFGQGYDNAHFDSGENWSWGPRFDGVVRPWTSPIDADGDGSIEALVRPYSAVPNQIEDFFQTGHTFDNNIAISGNTSGFNYYASYGNQNVTGIVDNTSSVRNSFNFRAGADLTPKLSSNFGITYSKKVLNTAQEGYRPFEAQNAYANAIQAPVNIPYTEVKDYKSPFQDLNGFYGSYSSNPYFILNEYINDGNIDNFFGNIELKYDLLENLSVTARAGLNTVNTIIETAVPSYTSPTQLVWTDDLQLTTRNTRQNSLGEYNKLTGKNTNVDATIMGNYFTDLSADFDLNVSAGYNIFDRRTENVTASTMGGLVVPGWYNVQNSVLQPLSAQSSTKYQIYGLLGNISLGWRDMIFLEYSARNDWSSTLPKENNSFFYQGVGASVVLSDLLGLQDNNVLNFVKLRGGLGTTGKDASPYLTASYFSGNPVIQSLNQHNIITPLNGQPGFTVGNFIGNPELKPELTKLFEFGADLGFFDNRINVEYTFYNSTHTDQIVNVNLPSSSGYTFTAANIGEMENKGHELKINLRPIQNLVKDLTWDLDLIYSTNDNKVIKISDQTDEITVGGPYTNGAISMVAKEGLPYGTFKSTVPMTTESGQIIVDQTGIPILTSEEVYLGAYQPDYTASLGTTIGFKGFALNVLVDVRKGGQFLSITKNQSEFNGTALSTLIGDREPFIIENSVKIDEAGNYVANDIEVTAQDLYAVSDVYFGGGSLLIDASFVKLRELGLSYTFPNSLLKNTPFAAARLKVFGSNLKYWLPEENTYADPEVNGASLNGNAVGIETTQIPSARSFGVNLGLTF